MKPLNSYSDSDRISRLEYCLKYRLNGASDLDKVRALEVVSGIGKNIEIQSGLSLKDRIRRLEYECAGGGSSSGDYCMVQEDDGRDYGFKSYSIGENEPTHLSTGQFIYAFFWNTVYVILQLGEDGTEKIEDVDTVYIDIAGEIIKLDWVDGLELWYQIEDIEVSQKLIDQYVEGETLCYDMLPLVDNSIKDEKWMK